MALRQILIFTGVAAMLLAACTHPAAIKQFSKQGKNMVADRLANINTDTIANDTTVNIAAVGDIMLGSSYPDSSGLPADKATGTFQYALNDLKKADIAFGNLEGVLLDTGAPVNYKLKFRNKGYLFRMPEEYGGILKNAGFNLLSVGNNHSNDFDYAGRKSTMKILDSLGIHTAGFKTHPSKTFTIKGVKYGFCAFSPNAQTVPLLQTGAAKKLIAELKAASDVVIVSFHGGGEGADFEHVKDSTEVFKGENRGNVKLFAHAAIDAGADLVLGHGPHVGRAIEVYKKRLIAYSLGNFATYKGVSVSGVCGLAPLLKLKLSKKGEFLNGEIRSYRQDHFAGVTPDTLKRAMLRIKALTQADFVQPGIMISNSGYIAPANAN
ncbi:CapA family protein [Mucilaginibacter litoreus]|uniref:CapA family protein n=1 Tax=Mucilaginibacter litoreus TaxID=1048221 RepID=A0ABW3AUT8_9SPHI